MNLKHNHIYRILGIKSSIGIYDEYRCRFDVTRIQHGIPLLSHEYPASLFGTIGNARVLEELYEYIPPPFVNINVLKETIGYKDRLLSLDDIREKASKLGFDTVTKLVNYPNSVISKVLYLHYLEKKYAKKWQVFHQRHGWISVTKEFYRNFIGRKKIT